MGCDGGTIPRRDELVKTKKKPEEKDRDSERLYRWKHCALSQAPLQHPIVACELGRMYNKEEIISRLLTKSKDEAISHIRGLKDVKVLNLAQNPNFREDTPRGDAYIDSQTSEYICPVTQQEMNGKSKFFFIWSCGCVVSERAMKEIKSERCHVCNKPVDPSNVIPLNPTEDDSRSLYDSMESRRAKAKAEKAKKKRENSAVEIKEEPEEGKKKKLKTSSSAAAAAASSSSSGGKGTKVSSFL